MISDRAFCCLYQVSEHNICPLIVSGKGATSDAMEVGYFCNSTPMVNLTYFHSVSQPPYSPSPTFLLDQTEFTGLLPHLLFLFFFIPSHFMTYCQCISLTIRFPSFSKISSVRSSRSEFSTSLLPFPAAHIDLNHIRLMHVCLIYSR